MTTSETGLVRQLTWRRRDTGWRLVIGRRRFGNVIPDSKHPTMCRSSKSGGRLSDMANLSWAKNAVVEQAVRELEWEARHRPATTLVKAEQTGAVFESSAPPMSQSEPAATLLSSAA